MKTLNLSYHIYKIFSYAVMAATLGGIVYMWVKMIQAILASYPS